VNILFTVSIKHPEQRPVLGSITLPGGKIPVPNVIVCLPLLLVLNNKQVVNNKVGNTEKRKITSP
jgi:hypothetical protein